jgi:hypothetical protein
MFGDDGDIRGVIPRSVEHLFQNLQKRTNTKEVAMVCSFLEIYNDQIRDLGKAYLVAMGVESSNSTALFEKTSDIFENLAGKRGNPYFAPAFHRPGSAMASNAENRPGLKEVQDEYNTMNYEIREDNEGNVFVKDLSLVPVTTMEEVMSMISMGLRVRATHETKMNAVSSRSHTVFTITVLQRDKITGEAITGMLNLVDLAGSERLKKSESQGVRLKEALHINTSLTALGKVIMALDPSSENTHIPYRDSKLTRVLQNSLGGNSYTTVIAAIHPNPGYYEECLSTLQFANRCRNVRNNPKVNYVEDGEDKDRKIRKLTEELAQIRNKLSQFGGKGGAGGGGGGDGGGGLSPSRLLQILKSVGLNASLASDGAIVVNGKRFTLEELGLAGDGSGLADHSMDGGGGAAAGGGKKDSQAVEKLQKVIKDLKESNETYAMRAKERKSQVEEQTREIQKLSAELVKCRTTIKHKEFEYTSLLEEKERSLAELRAILESKHREEIENILKSNHELLQIQQQEKEKIPEALKEYTELVNKIEKQKVVVEKPLKAEFSQHLNHLDKSRVTEIENLKKQYEYWLNEKDKALSGFVEAFNAYRNKKSEQLRLAEQEIVKLYDYTERLEEILNQIEQGKFQVRQSQGMQGGKSTTGLLETLYGGTGGNTGGGGAMGSIVLPRGIRPMNPLKITPIDGGDELAVTKRIVGKHRERVARLEKMKEEAFQKSLHFAAQTGATALGTMDDNLKNQVKSLLLSKTPSSKNLRPSTGNGLSSGAGSPTTSAKYNNNSASSSPVRSALTTAGGDMPPSSAPMGTGEFIDDFEFVQDGTANSFKPFSRGGTVGNDPVNTQQALADLANNDTFNYIQSLQGEVDRLRKQLKDVTTQLTSSKVSFLRSLSIAISNWNSCFVLLICVGCECIIDKNY